MTSQKEDMHFGIISTTQDQQEMLGKIPVRFVNSLVSFRLIKWCERLKILVQRQTKI